MAIFVAYLIIPFLFDLFGLAVAQGIGGVTPETHPPLPLNFCTKASGCTAEGNTAMVIDSQWRWLHKMDGYKNCMDDDSGEWDPDICPDPETCSSSCGVEGLKLDDYESTYGVQAIDGGVKLLYVPGSRVYVLESPDKYKMFKLLNRELSIDVDVSTLPCGTNAAVYFVEMPESGEGEAGAKYGTGYCDAQCPAGMKFVTGKANVLDWKTHIEKKTAWGTLKDAGAAGKYGACCAEMDIFEANNKAQALTAHPCKIEGAFGCSSVEECGDKDVGENGVCDKDGCGFNSYRMGVPNFYGEGSQFTVDTSKPFTVVTQFITADGTDTGDLVEIRRQWVQDGKVIENSQAPILGAASGDSMTDDLCRQSADIFNASVDSFTLAGGLKAMGGAIGRGMVLTLSVWDDPFSNMLWLDSHNMPDENMSFPGVARGPCEWSDYDKSVRHQNAGAYVKYMNIKYGEIGSTVAGASPAAPTAAPAVPATYAPDPTMAATTQAAVATAPMATLAPSTSAPAVVTAVAESSSTADGFEAKAGSDCFPGQNAHFANGDPATCKEKCAGEFKDDCTAVIAVAKWNQCYFRSNSDCASNLVPAEDHVVYLRQAPQASVPEVGEQSTEQEGFSEFKEYDCFSGSNAYGTVGKPSTCKSECLNRADCIAVVVNGENCYFRNVAGCGDNLEQASGHTTFIRTTVAKYEAQALGSLRQGGRVASAASTLAVGVAILLAIILASITSRCRSAWQQSDNRVSPETLRFLADADTQAAP